jgi:cysteinyl-tRNA synthetase
MSLVIYDSLRREEVLFTPLTPGKVSLYVCGPTVYDRAHIGNARSAVVFDLLHRVLRQTYDVTYVRNITDVDDKIMDAAQARQVPIEVITAQATQAYHEDMDALFVLRPTHEPRATAYIGQMQALIQVLLDKGHAYIAEGHVLFDTLSHPGYGKLSRHAVEDMIAGARVEVAPYKKNPQDFVLWKPSQADQPGWESPWGRGRPGWHIECSAMSLALLGETFDIHGGGHDLQFPHHENELAQSTCAHGDHTFARHWMHNGMLMVNGAKMSKSLGNFFTVQDLLAQAQGQTIRYAFLATHYRQPLDWQDATLPQAKQALDRFYLALKGHRLEVNPDLCHASITDALNQDLNTPLALSVLHHLTTEVNKASSPMHKEKLALTLYNSGLLLGLFGDPVNVWFHQKEDAAAIEALIEARRQARATKNFAEADRIRHELDAQGIVLEDSDGRTTWRKK